MNSCQYRPKYCQLGLWDSRNSGKQGMLKTHDLSKKRSTERLEIALQTVKFRFLGVTLLICFTWIIFTSSLFIVILFLQCRRQFRGDLQVELRALRQFWHPLDTSRHLPQLLLYWRALLPLRPTDLWDEVWLLDPQGRCSQVHIPQKQRQVRLGRLSEKWQLGYNWLSG